MSEIKFPNGSVVKLSNTYEVADSSAMSEVLSALTVGRAEALAMIEDPNYFCMDCDEFPTKAEVVGHGMRDGQLYDEPRCMKHYNASKRNQS